MPDLGRRSGRYSRRGAKAPPYDGLISSQPGFRSCVPGGSSLLSARRVSKSYGPRSVLHDVELVVPPRARIALIGPNGIGKSTLLRILAGLEEPDTGEVVSAGLVGYLPQEPEPRPGETVRDYLARRTGVAEAEAELERREAELPHGIEEHAAALEPFLALGGDDLDARARGVAGLLGLHA